MDVNLRFHWADYLVLSLFLVGSSLIGVVVGFRERKRMTSKNFFNAGGEMPWILVAFSMQASFMSSIFLLSMPVEVYAWGTTYYYMVISYLVAVPLSGHFVMAVFYRLQLTSAYEYLETRFNKRVRTACALCFFLEIFLYMSVVLYSPSLALAQVTGLSVPLSIILCGLVCTFYTAVGGMKATIWNDFIQVVIIGVTLVLLVILGILKVGGFQRMWEISTHGGRIKFDEFRVDPTIRTTFWTQTVGGMFVNFSMYASNQTSIQKFAGVGTLNGAKKSVFLSAVSTSVFFTLVCTLGLAAYAFYSECHPLHENKIDELEQIVPLYVMEVMGHLPGLPGLFMAAVFSAGLSSMSGNLNAITAVTLTDFVCPLYLKVRKSPLDEKVTAILSRGLTLIFGILVIGMGFAVQYFGKVVVQIAFSIFGFVGSPLTFALVGGMLLPFVNSIGTACALFSSLVVTSWVAIGAIVSKMSTPTLPMGTNCTSLDHNLTGLVAMTIAPIADDSPVMNIYKISHMYYGLIALVVYLVVVIPVSLMTGRNKKVDRRLIIDLFEECCCCLPTFLRNCLRCGTEIVEEEDEEIKPEIIVKSVSTYINDVMDKQREMTIKVPSPGDPDKGSGESSGRPPTIFDLSTTEAKRAIRRARENMVSTSF